MSGYRTREVAGLVGLTPAQVRRYVQQGVLSPGRGARGEYLFDFQDVVLLRTARGLRQARVPARRALKALRKLRLDLGDARSLSSLRIQASGATVVVARAGGSEQGDGRGEAHGVARSDGTALWDAETGQGHFDFSTRDLAGEVAELARRRLVAEGQPFDADDYYNLGVDLEDVDPARAVEAYHRALELDPGNADAHVNLGRLLQIEGHHAVARDHYRLALARAPDHQLAMYNLGTSFDEADDIDKAVTWYRRADDVADAHYNLCRIFELRGDEVAALRHLRRYRQLCGATPT